MQRDIERQRDREREGEKLIKIAMLRLGAHLNAVKSFIRLRDQKHSRLVQMYGDDDISMVFQV